MIRTGLFTDSVLFYFLKNDCCFVLKTLYLHYDNSGIQSEKNIFYIHTDSAAFHFAPLTNYRTGKYNRKCEEEFSARQTDLYLRSRFRSNSKQHSN